MTSVRELPSHCKLRTQAAAAGSAPVVVGMLVVVFVVFVVAMVITMPVVVVNADKPVSTSDVVVVVVAVIATPLLVHVVSPTTTVALSLMRMGADGPAGSEIGIPAPSSTSLWRMPATNRWLVVQMLSPLPSHMPAGAPTLASTCIDDDGTASSPEATVVATINGSISKPSNMAEAG